MQDILFHSEPVAAELRRYLESRRRDGAANRWHRDAVERLQEFTTSGKLLRGALVCFAYQAFGGKRAATARQVAVAIELVHSALLIHDDIIDRDPLRRGRPSMYRQYQLLADTEDALHYGESMAICVADAALFMAFELLGSIDAPASSRKRLHARFSEVLATVCAGQMLDIDLGHVDSMVEKRDIMTVMEQKTAQYSIALPLAAGAILAGQDEQVERQLMELGAQLGVIYQIRDDELGVFGDSDKTGKPVGSDIKEGKKTLLHYYLMQDCSDAERKRLRGVFGNSSATEADIELVRGMMTEKTVPSQVQLDVEALTSPASKLIGKLPLDKPGRENLQDLLAFCARREL